MTSLHGKLLSYLHQQSALHYRNYRLFMAGQGLSVVGTWIQRLAMMWLVYRVTNSAFLLGLVAFCERIPILLIAPFAGVFADRWKKRKALMWIESAAMLQALILAFLTFSNLINIWYLVALSLFLGTVSAFEVPVRQSFVVEMVNGDKEALPNAIAFNSMVFNLSRLIGPSVAGFMIAGVGEGWCFMANAFSYAMIVGSLFLMKITDVAFLDRKKRTQVFKQLKDGFQYVSHHKIMTSLLLVLAVVSFSNASVRTLGPVFARDILKGNASTLGFLMSAVGFGAICGAFSLTKKRSVPALHKIVTLTGILLGIGIVGFSFSKWLWLSMIFLAIAGFAQMMHTATTNTLLQLHTDDDKRGRVMSFYTVCLQGVTPIGSLFAGSIAGIIGGAWAAFSMGAFCFVVALIYRERKVMIAAQKKG